MQKNMAKMGKRNVGVNATSLYDVRTTYNPLQGSQSADHRSNDNDNDSNNDSDEFELTTVNPNPSESKPNSELIMDAGVEVVDGAKGTDTVDRIANDDSLSVDDGDVLKVDRR